MSVAIKKWVKLAKPAEQMGQEEQLRVWLCAPRRLKFSNHLPKQACNFPGQAGRVFECELAAGLNQRWST